MTTTEFIKTEKFEDNIDKYGWNDNTCECCGKPMKVKKYFVNTIEGPEVVEPHITEEEMLANGVYSQGIFYVGPECIKKYDKEFRGIVK